MQTCKQGKLFKNPFAICFSYQILKPSKLLKKSELKITYRTITLLANNDIGYAFVNRIFVVLILSVEEDN